VIGFLGLAPAEDVIDLIERDDLNALRSVSDIDGVSVDMEAITDAAGADLDRRLETLSDLVGRQSVPDSRMDNVTETARNVLEQSKFEVGGEGFLDRLGALILAWFDRFLAWLSSALGGPTNTALVVIGVVVLLGLAAFTFLARRRSAVLEEEFSLERLIAEGGDPAEFERSAADAAARGSWDEALRYRFLAGLLRLDLSGRISFRPGLTTGEIAATLSDDRFDGLVDVFNDVAYGGRHADEAAYRASVDTWVALLTPERSRS
jgi:hypothetical protein